MQKDINIAIKKKLSSYADAKGFIISYANIAFKPPSGLYLDLHILPAPTYAPDLTGVMREYKGICQINVNVNAGSGEESALDVARELTEEFSYNSTIDVQGHKLYIISVPSISKVVQSPSSYTVPVSFMYKLDVY